MSRVEPLSANNLIKAGITYFGIVFGAGFILGPIRILLLVPNLGERLAELIELPLMLIVIIFAARRIIEKFEAPYLISQRLSIGFIALSILLLFEFTLVLKLRGITITEYFQSRDPISGTAYYLSLLVFALMPMFVGKDKGLVQNLNVVR
jgi:MFS family permease